MNYRWSWVLNCLLIFATEFAYLNGDRRFARSTGSNVPNPRIVEHPEDQYVAKNDPATLNCKAEGDPPPTITWYRNGEPVITSRENPTSHRTLVNNGQLFFYRIIHNKNNKPDVGVYYCNATNKHGTALSKNATLEIAVLREDFRENPKSINVAIGSPAVLNCKPPKGQPEPRVKWLKDGNVVLENSRVRIHKGGNLVITDTKKGDSGTYVCVAYSIAGERRSSPATVSVLEKPKFLKNPEDVLVTENEDVEFRCRASGDPDPVIVWRKENGQIPSARARILDDKSLKITGVKVTDEGNYICKAENPVGTIEHVARLSVHSHPSFITTPQDKVVGVGRTVTLKCEVTGNPPPAVFWNKENSQVLMFPRQDHGRFSVSEEGTLIISRVMKDDAGMYICQALSVAGSAYARAKVEVKDVDPRPPPIIHQGPQNQTLPVYSVAMLICQSSGDPPPSIKWFKDGRSLESGANTRITLLGSGTLQISDLQFSDTGLYTCKAVSETGETTWSAALTVEAPSKASVIFHRTPEPSTFPGAPSKPIITEINENSVTLKWTPNPNQGASPVFAYTVEYFSHETGEGWVVASDHITLNEYDVKNIRKDTSYMFLVRARNSHGLSLPSPVSDAVRTLGGDGSRPTLAQFDIPLVEEKLSGNVVVMRDPEVISSTAIKINWNVQKSHKYIEGYHIKYRPMPLTHSHHHHHHHVEYNIETVTSAQANMYVLRNLQKYTWYEIRIQPFYLTVEGQLSNAVRVQTFEDVPSMPPQNIQVTRQKNNTIRIEWEPPAKNHRNGNIKGYKVYCIGNSSKFSLNITTNASTHQLLIMDTISTMQYKIYLAATTRMGVGVRSEPYILNIPSMKKSIVTEMWFQILTIIIVGVLIVAALIIFVIWLIRKHSQRKKMPKNPVLNLPLKSEETERNDIDKDDVNPVGMNRPYGNQPDLLEKRINPNLDDNMYHMAQMKTFYNKNNCAVLPPVAPYATTTLVNSNNIINNQSNNTNSAFRPVNKGSSGYITGNNRSGSSDSCTKVDLNDSNSDNSRPNTEQFPDEILDENGYPVQRTNRNVLPPGLQQQINKTGVLNLGDLLPPPPEHPPPSDIGTPPESPGRLDSPTMFTERSHLMQSHSPMSTQPRNVYNRCPQDRLPTPPRNMSDSERRSLSPRQNWPEHVHRSQPPTNYQANNRIQSPHCGRSGSPARGNFQMPRQTMSENEATMGPFRGGYNMLSDNDMRMMSDNERGPTPATVHGFTGMNDSSNPLMDRGIQSSLPSLASDHNSPVNHGRMDCAPNEMCVDGPVYNTVGEGPVYNGRHSPGSEVNEYVGESDGEHMSTVGEHDHEQDDNWGFPLHNLPYHSPLPGNYSPVTGNHSPYSGNNSPHTGKRSMMASWASVTDNSNSDVSNRSSLASSSDGSFLTEADFATAVAKAAELSGLTVVGSTVQPDPNQGKRRHHRHRERAKQQRPQSPYSTDSNYSAVPPQARKPYPKSERKKQLQEQAHRQRRDNNPDGQKLPPAPPERLPPQNELNRGPNSHQGPPGNMPYNNRGYPPNMPVNPNMPNGQRWNNSQYPRNNPSDASDTGLQTQPLLYDIIARDTPIV